MLRTEAIDLRNAVVTLAQESCRGSRPPEAIAEVAAALRAMPGLVVIGAGGPLPADGPAAAFLVEASAPVTLTLPPMAQARDVVIVTAGAHDVAIVPAAGEEISGGDRPVLSGGDLSFVHLQAAGPWGWEVVVFRGLRPE